MMKSPLCLIENIEKNGNLILEVQPEALKILSQIKQQVVVVAVVGMYRTGKSYLMNKLAGEQKGFSLGSTIQSETKGIWMWCVPHPMIKDVTLILLDTEGLGDVEKGDSKNDTWLFSLAILLSSALVYNSKGTIDQDALDKLKFVMDISEMIKVKSQDNENEEDMFSTHFPNFIWAVRDFHLELKLEGKSITEDEYMENALKLKQAKKLSRKDVEFNNLREDIRKFFGRRKCFTFDMPTFKKEHLHHLEEISDSELSPSFVAQTKKFCDYVFRNAEVKRLDVTVPVTGDRLGELAKFYTEAVRSSKFACMEDAVVSLAEKENKAAIEEATKHYEVKMNELKMPTETVDAFMNVSRQYEEEARQMFLKKAFKDEDHKFITALMENIRKIKNDFISKNEEMSREICNAILKDLCVNLEKSLAAGEYRKPGGHAKYKLDRKNIEDKYNMKKGKGLKADEVLQKYLMASQATEVLILMEDNTLTQQQRDKEEQLNKQKMDDMLQKIKDLENDEEKKRIAAENSCLQDTIKQLMEKMDENHRIMNERLEQVRKEKDQEMQRYLKEGLERQAAEYQQSIRDMEERMKPKKKKCTIL